MTQLNQMLAVANGRKARTQAEITRIHHMVQKAELLQGISRTYTPKDDDGDRLPPESKMVQYTVNTAISEARAVLTELFDAVAAQDNTNCAARANIVIDGKMLVADVPVTHLLFLEKQLTDLRTFIDKLPTLDPAQKWSFDDSIAAWRSETQATTKTKKVSKPIVLYEATKEHPAQVQLVHEDEVVGQWAKTDFSGAIQAVRKNVLLSRVRKLQEAVAFAREQANSVDVVDLKTGGPIFDYMFA